MITFKPVMPPCAAPFASPLLEHGGSADPLSACSIWNENGGSVLGGTASPHWIRSEHLDAFRELGGIANDPSRIEAKLKELHLRFGHYRMLMAAGWMVIADGGRGLWPTAAFREAWLSFKKIRSDAGDTKLYALGLKRENDFFGLLALSLSCPEVLDHELRGYLECERRKRSDRNGALMISDDLRRFDDEGFRSLQMTGSYLGNRPDLPWSKDDAEGIGEAIHAILLKTVGEMTNPAIGMATWDELYRPAAMFDRGHTFRNAVHIARFIREGIWDLPMPVSAVRLNIELPCDGGFAHLAFTARSLARIVADGHHVSAKFTLSDHNGDPRFWNRLCLYVPTCAVSLTMQAFLPLFHGENLSWTQNLVNGDFPGQFNILLPRFCSLRGTGEGGETTVAQFEEARVAVASLGITHQVLRSPRAD